VRLPTPEATTGLTLSPAGAAAWMVPQNSGSTLLVGALVTERPLGLRLVTRQLDSGRIIDVRLSGLKMSWVNDRQQRSVNLR
jgi:hypothetical protein